LAAGEAGALTCGNATTLIHFSAVIVRMIRSEVAVQVRLIMEANMKDKEPK